MNKIEKSVNRFEGLPEKLETAIAEGDFKVVNAGLGTFELTCFIVPNGSYILKENEIFKMGSYIDETVRRNTSFGIKTTPEDEVMQTWIFPSNELFYKSNDNWTDHGLPDQFVELFNNEGYAPAVLPYSFLKDRKEGEVVELESASGFRYRMRFEQLPWRYGRYGRFEDVVRNLHKKSA